MSDRCRPTVWIANDNPDDCLIALRARQAASLPRHFRFVHDGRELLTYLLRRRRYAFHADAPEPSLILRDLHMPRKDGRQAPLEIQAQPTLRHIPIVIPTNSPAVQDEHASDQYGAHEIRHKPSSVQGYVRLVKQLWQAFTAPLGTPHHGHQHASASIPA